MSEEEKGVQFMLLAVSLQHVCACVSINGILCVVGLSKSGGVGGLDLRKWKQKGGWL